MSLLFFCIFIVASYGQVGTYSTVHVEIGQNIKFEATIFKVTFSEDLLLDGQPLSNTSIVVPPPFRDNDGPIFPSAMTVQFGGTTLTCQEQVYQSVPDISQGGTPTFFIPGLAVENSASILFSIFAGALDANDVVPLPNTFTGMKITRIWDGRVKQWQDLVQPNLYDPATCQLVFVPGFYGGAINGSGTTITSFEVSAEQCDYAAFQLVWQQMQISMDAITEAAGRSEMEQKMWKIASLQISDAWRNCEQLVNSMTVIGDVNKTIGGTKDCFETPWSTEWLQDPCCNELLQYEQCCIAREQQITVPGLIGTNDQIVDAQCSHPTQSKAVLADFVKKQGLAQKCDAIAKQQGADWEVTRELSQFVNTCYEELFGGSSGPPTCLSDDDCYTSCDTQSNTCVIPYGNPDAALLDCFGDHIDPLLERHWRQEWNLTGSSTREEFLAQFQANLYDNACVGPTAYQFNKKWMSEQVSNCTNYADNCWCYNGLPSDGRAARTMVQNRLSNIKRQHVAFKTENENMGHSERAGTLCFHSYEIEADQQGCEADMACNWDQSRDISTCTGGQLTTHFCGECNTGQCVDRSVSPMCYTWVASTQRCLDQGGTIGPWGLWHCVFGDLDTEGACLPVGTCPARPTIAEDKESALGDHWCAPMCQVTGATNQSACESLNAFPRDVRSKHTSVPDLLKLLWKNHQTVYGVFLSNKTDPELHERLENLNYLLRAITKSFNGIPTWWNSDLGVCQTSLWDQACIENNDTQWFSGRTFRPGVLDTSGKCTEGRCSVDMRMSASDCAAHASCNKPCFKCRPRNWGKTLCYNAEITLESECVNGAGELVDGVCVYDMLRSSSTCLAFNASNVFEQCETQTVDECGTSSAISVFAATRLECYPNHWDRCDTQQQCASNGDCDDWDFQNWFSPSCWSNVDSAKSATCTGTCITPFDLATGWPQCSNTQKGWTRIGCADYTILSPTDCALANGTWYSRAFDSDSCVAHGQGCKERKYWNLTPKDQSTCTTCGGTPQPYYNWRSGVWSTGEMIPLTWKVRAYESINRWQPTLDWEKLYAAIDRVSSKVIGSAMKSSLMCKFNLVAKTIETLACDCTTNDATGACFASAQVPLFEQQFFSGLSNSADNVLGSISVTPTSVPAISDSATVKVYSVTTTTPTQIVSRHFLKSPYEPNEYEVVMNHAAYIVGQLVGGGVTIDIPEGVTINVCLNLDPDIPVDPEMIYPIADFGGYNATATGEAGDPNYWPDNLDVTVLTGPDRYCADVNESGTYFPIRRLADWETATGIPPTPQPTSAPTAAPTSAPTALTSAPTAPAPTVAPTTLNGVAITGIVIACVFATILIILLIMYCVRMCKEPQAYLEMEKELRIGRKIRRPIRRPLRGHGLKQV